MSEAPTTQQDLNNGKSLCSKWNGLELLRQVVSCPLLATLKSELQDRLMEIVFRRVNWAGTRPRQERYRLPALAARTAGPTKLALAPAGGPFSSELTLGFQPKERLRRPEGPCGSRAYSLNTGKKGRHSLWASVGPSRTPSDHSPSSPPP